MTEPMARDEAGAGPAMDLVLRAQEIGVIRRLLANLANRFDSAEDEEFLRQAAVLGQELPRRVRAMLYEFKLTEPAAGLCLLYGYPVDDGRIGATPGHWQQRTRPTPVLQEEMLLVLLASLLGEPIAWATQQDARLVHDILPIKGHEGEQLGSGSEQLLWWHNEDAFHPFRGDYLAMLCLRNPNGVATTFASLEEIDLEPRHLDLLFEPHYTIRPDESHLEKNRGAAVATDVVLERSYETIARLNDAPEPVPVLSGDRRSPYLRIDPYFMARVENAAAQSALDALVSAIDAKLGDLVLAPGTFAFIDNFKAVHGRKPFVASFDGRDRWLKRVNITRDLRKSRSARRDAVDRVIC